MNTIKFNIDKLKNYGILYLSLPLFLFCVLWLKLYIALPILLIFIYIIIRLLRRKGTAADNILELNFPAIILIILAVLFWCYTSGIGGGFYQSWDQHFKNAAFRDLINFKWPVIYERYNIGLVYYFGIWIVPALMGKLVIFLGFSKNVAWIFANIFLYLWCTLGLLLSMLLLCSYCKCHKFLKVLMLLGVFMAFSSPDIIGHFIVNGIYFTGNIEWWSVDFALRSNTTSIFWAYNQAIPLWLAGSLFLEAGKEKYIPLVLVLTLFYSPFCAIGLVPFYFYFILMYIKKKVSENNKKDIVSYFINIENVFAYLVILPILYLFYTSNTSVGSGLRLIWQQFDMSFMSTVFIEYVLFICIEVLTLFFCLLIIDRHNVYIYISCISILLLSMMIIGEGTEVAFRISATMPAVFFLSVVSIKELSEIKKINYKAYILGALILIGAITPLMEYARAANAIRQNRSLAVVADSIRTYNSRFADHNFAADNIDEKFFYKYMANYK